MTTIEDKTNLFYSKIRYIVTDIPRKVIKIKKWKDKKWITPVIKILVNNRWKAYKNRDFSKYNNYKEKVHQEIKNLKNCGRREKYFVSSQGKC